MAKTTGKGKQGRAKATAASARASDTPRDPAERILAGAMETAQRLGWRRAALADIAAAAGVSLAELHSNFADKGAILRGIVDLADRKVLMGMANGPDMESSPRDRLFDVLMRRFDALAPYRAGVESIAHWARREPLAAAALNRMVVNSMRFMLEAAGIDSEGGVGALKLQGLTLAWARLVNIWLADDDPGMAATMAELDRTLRRGDMLVARVQDVERLTSPLRSIARGVVNAGLRFARDRRAKAGEKETERA